MSLLCVGTSQSLYDTKSQPVVRLFLLFELLLQMLYLLSLRADLVARLSQLFKIRLELLVGLFFKADEGPEHHFDRLEVCLFAYQPPDDLAKLSCLPTRTLGIVVRTAYLHASQITLKFQL